MTTNAVWIVIAIIVLVLVIVGALWGSYWRSRADRTKTQRETQIPEVTQRELHSERSADPPYPLNPTISPGESYSTESVPRIQWGADDIQYDFSRPIPTRIHWGRVDELPGISDEEIPDLPTASETRKCPLCKQLVEIDSDVQYHAPCDTYYHPACWTDLLNNYGGQCLICRDPLS